MHEWAKRGADIIVDLYDPDKIMLFGSCAKGSATLDSDIDLLIVKDTDITLCLQRCGNFECLVKVSHQI